MTDRHYLSTCLSVPALRLVPLAPKTPKTRQERGQAKPGRPTESENPSSHTVNNRYFSI